MSNTDWHISVLVPACNEELLLPRCLSSIIKAAQQLPQNCSYNIILAVDSSNDRSFEIGSTLISTIGQVIEVQERIVGCVRMHAAALALANYDGPLENCWLANTDADCEIPATWLTYQLEVAMSGIQAIAGIVSVDSFEEHNDYVAKRFEETYLLFPDGTHPHVHGANMGVRADTYLKAGGWKPIETAEDHDLWNRLIKLNVPIKSDAQLSVITSGRRVGRAPSGFANALAAHNKVDYD